MLMRELVAAMDVAVFGVLADDALVDGRAVRGMFTAPWIGPPVGRLQTGIIEPQLALRDGDAVGIQKGAVVTFDGLDYEVVAIEPDGTGLTILVLRPST
ncbi:hypothetical protein D5039_00085 [Verminephrobacter aporrectodeae subsp. tuberculatae]|uniref:Uncharacterized protein n=1 Tax=Verminephrobacter aporrectodeae subsp. tuberculatae TaxID=1110392 RepID=A0ABT3KMT7_9BURK|nr:hypothetical protein [Verminephrobacter aporrectodeae]MCW5319633.1 hypothetical protein [Verminephrobacter aporrectodeae subsp. tuberculatae]